MSDEENFGHDMPIGKVVTVTINGKVGHLQVQKRDPGNGRGCEDCFFYELYSSTTRVLRNGKLITNPEEGYCHMVACVRIERDDDLHVIFTEMQ